jgi:geranylgeranyl diphosphate synthase type II
MKSVSELRDIVENSLKKIKYPTVPSSLYEPVQYFIGLRAKRIRAILVLLGYQLFASKLDKALAPALAIELFHNFTLLHDDIMDNAPLRRGEETVHKKWNKNIAILSGDTMVIKSYQLLSNLEPKTLKKVLDVFNNSAINVCEGQQLDMDFEKDHNVSLNQYIKMIENKTSVLLAAALEIGAIVAGASIKDQNNLYNFGINIGIAFQLKDDFLDAFGSPDIFGKELGGDIASGKRTYLYLKALELADQETRNRLKKYYSKDYLHANKVQQVKDIYISLKIPEFTTNLMKAYHNKAIDYLNCIHSDKKAPLVEFSDTLLERIS